MCSCYLRFTSPTIISKRMVNIIILTKDFYVSHYSLAHYAASVPILVYTSLQTKTTRVYEVINSDSKKGTHLPLEQATVPSEK